MIVKADARENVTRDGKVVQQQTLGKVRCRFSCISSCSTIIIQSDPGIDRILNVPQNKD